MFLALKEMKHAKLRYSLIIGIMFLIALVVFLLSGLADGLAKEFRQVFDDWDAEHIVLSEESNNVLAASQLSLSTEDNIDAKTLVPVSLYSGAVGSGDDKQNISLFGTTKNAFFLPKILEGRTFENDKEIIISKNLANDGYAIGDIIKMGSDAIPVEIVGIFPKTSYTVSPVIYSTVETVTEIKYGTDLFSKQNDYPINAILSSDKVLSLSDDSLVRLSTNELIESIPGYAEQNLTLNAMIYFLFVIAAAVIAIFMYVITLQKTAIFGVMKVQGISTWFISKSIIAQSFLVGMFGVIAAAIVTYLLSFALPSAMPFAVNLGLWSIYAVILIIVAVIGGLFSTITVNKVDPIQAIGG